MLSMLLIKSLKFILSLKKASVLLTIPNNLKDARLVGLAHFVGGEAGHGPVVEVRLGDVGELAGGPVDGELGMLDVSLKKT